MFHHMFQDSYQSPMLRKAFLPHVIVTTRSRNTAGSDDSCPKYGTGQGSGSKTTHARTCRLRAVSAQGPVHKAMRLHTRRSRVRSPASRLTPTKNSPISKETNH